MSHTLGPIHYWLYGKIGKQEELTNRIAVFAENSGWISDCEAYVKKLPPLEEVIDEGNIQSLPMTLVWIMLFQLKQHPKKHIKALRISLSTVCPVTE